MNIMRIGILGVAALAAGAAALMVRGILGGGTPDVQAEVPAQFGIVQVLVATESIEPGRILTVDSVRWADWPDTSVDSKLITQDAHPDLEEFIEGAVSRSPLILGEPITEDKIARADNASFMAATLSKGKRAVSIPISDETGAGGFILPNDRVDVILTQEIEDELASVYQSDTILYDIRVLAIDQVLRQEDDQEYVVASTATLELDPDQSVRIAQGQAAGELSLALRGLGDSANVFGGSSLQQGVNVKVVRFGVARVAERNLLAGGGGK